jgi:hypothetical protein
MGVVTALFLVGAPMAQAQVTPDAGDAHGNGRLSSTEFKILTDARVGMVKVALQLTPEQQQHWPAVEDAIRARSEARYRRLSAFGERLVQWREVDPVQLYLQRADAMAERAGELKRLADAWQPLYQSLTQDQKMRLRIVAVRAIEGLRAAVENRHAGMYVEEDFDFGP